MVPSSSKLSRISILVSKVMLLTIFQGDKAFEILVRENIIDKERIEEILKQSHVIPGTRYLIITLEVGWYARNESGTLAAFIGYTFPLFVISILFYTVYPYFLHDNFGIIFISGAFAATLAILAVSVNARRIKHLKTPGDYITIMLYFALYFTGFPVLFILLGAGGLNVANYYYQRAKPVEFQHKFEGENMEKFFAPEYSLERNGKFLLIIWAIALLVLAISIHIWSSEYLEIVNIIYTSWSLNFLGGLFSISLLFETYSTSGILEQSTFVAILALGFLTYDGILILSLLLALVLLGVPGGIIALLVISVPVIFLFVSLKPFFQGMRRSILYKDLMRGFNIAIIAILYGNILIFAFDNMTTIKGAIVFVLVALVYYLRKKNEAIFVLTGGIISLLLTVIQPVFGY